MPRYIDEDGLKHSIWEYTDKYGHIEMTINFFNILLERNRVDAVPLEDYKSMEQTVNKLTKAIADAEPVVRCKDCKYASMTHDGECKYCQRWKEKYDGESVSLYLDGDFYCAWGERKEDVEIN